MNVIFLCAGYNFTKTSRGSVCWRAEVTVRSGGFLKLWVRNHHAAGSISNSLVAFLFVGQFVGARDA